MPVSMDKEKRMFTALKRISLYTPPDKLRRQAQKDYGLDYQEALEYAYENVLEEARRAIKGIRIKRQEEGRRAK